MKGREDAKRQVKKMDTKYTDLKLIVTPPRTKHGDFQKLKALGFSSEQIFEMEPKTVRDLVDNAKRSGKLADSGQNGSEEQEHDERHLFLIKKEETVPGWEDHNTESVEYMVKLGMKPEDYNDIPGNIQLMFVAQYMEIVDRVLKAEELYQETMELLSGRLEETQDKLDELEVKMDNLMQYIKEQQKNKNFLKVIK
ncbi:hypothetical protein [Geotalea sp. SG265]|uniref:hypothetical protein n=1 Tax=Geotalea sp. SG265 TaxID=2922867 RepID=UPI001FAFE6E8|nr:hypothetical protein [Geotalea sp. SG265]